MKNLPTATELACVAAQLAERHPESQTAGRHHCLSSKHGGNAVQRTQLRGSYLRHQRNDIDADIYPLFAPANNLVDVVAGGADNGSPASLGWMAMKVIEAACRSARTNTNVKL